MASSMMRVFPTVKMATTIAGSNTGKFILPGGRCGRHHLIFARRRFPDTRIFWRPQRCHPLRPARRRSPARRRPARRRPRLRPSRRRRARRRRRLLHLRPHYHPRPYLQQSSTMQPGNASCPSPRETALSRCARNPSVGKPSTLWSERWTAWTPIALLLALSTTYTLVATSLSLIKVLIQCNGAPRRRPAFLNLAS